MKKYLIPTALFLFLVGSFTSCKSPKYGHFNNSYKTYSKTEVTSLEAPNELTTSASTTAEPLVLSEQAEPSRSSKSIAKTLPANANTIAEATEKPLEKSALKKQIKAEIKAQKDGQESDVNTLLLVIIALILPPLAVFIVDGIGGPFLLSIILTLFFWIPGVIYALYRVLR